MVRLLRMTATVTVALALVGAFAGTALACKSASFSASYSGTAGFSSPSSTYFIGSGVASQMGSITTDGTADQFQPDSSCPGGIFNVNVQTLTASNGDQLTVTSNDVACPTGPGQYHGSGTWEVSGGTGKFASAVGSGTFDGNSDFVAGTFQINLIGSISQGVPFKIDLSGVSTITSPTSGDLQGSGNASHLGRATNTGHVEAHPELPSDTCPYGFTSYNTETFTAANGDQLSIRSTDVACPQGPGQFLGSGHWLVTGGTGRFSDALGWGTFNGFVDFTAQTFQISFTGTIRY